MILDVIIGVLSALAQFVTAFLGWQVTVKPIGHYDARKKRMYKVGFVAAGIIGILAVGLATYRANDASERLAAALGVRKPDLTGSPAGKLRFSLDSALAGRPIAVTMRNQNTGLIDARNVKGFALVEIYDGGGDIHTFCGDLEEHLRNLVNMGQTANGQTVSVGKDYVVQVSGRTISSDEAELIQAGELGVYVAGFYSYSGDVQSYQWRYRKRINGKFGDCTREPWKAW
jgi:hypothetical protein